MIDHISKREMNEFCARRLEAHEMSVLAEHLGDCAICRARFDEVFDDRRAHAPVKLRLSHDWLANQHLDFDQLVPLVEEGLDATAREIAQMHLLMCKECRDDVQSFRAFRQQTERELRVRYAPDIQSSRWMRFLPRLTGTEVHRKLVYAAAIILIFAGAAALTLIFMKPEKRFQQALKRPITPSIMSSSNSSDANGRSNDPDSSEKGFEATQKSNTAEKTAPILSDQSSQPDGAFRNSRRSKTLEMKPSGRKANAIKPAIEAAPLIALTDNSRTVILDRSGRISGLENVSPATRQAIKQMLLARIIEKPPVLFELRGEGGTLRGAADTNVSFKLLSPSGSVLIEDRPLLSWEPCKEAASYLVQVIDSRNHEAARSSELSPDITRWRPASALNRGVVYTWIVTAVVHGETVISPGASSPEMKFKILGETEAGELNQLKRLNSHLALGAFYTRAGMIKEAQVEFQLLKRENPHSAIAIKLLRSIESWK